jgi:hypothetical protein
MSFEDTQIDVLLRRHAERASSNAGIEHLDADELNAFAERSLPAAARSRYVSHLADCDDCRRLVSQLAISAGAVAKAEAGGAPATAHISWFEKLGVFFRPPAFRYVAFAAVVVAAVGVAFLVMRQNQQNRESTLVAQNGQPSQAGTDSTKSEETAKASPEKAAVANTNLAGTPAGTTPQSRLSPEREESKTLANPQAVPKPQKETDEDVALADKKITQPEVAASNPSYAPAPPQETLARVETKSSNPQLRPGIGGASPQSSGTLFGQTGGMDRKQSTQPASQQSKDDNSAIAQNQTTINGRLMNDKAKGPRRDADNVAAANRSVNEVPPAPKTEDRRDEKRSTSGEESETRSVGGHKFRRQGNAWVDAKFKSSMGLKSISRGSEEFAALDSRLRSIAQQVGGEVIIVWKGKAYLIR